MSETYYYSIKKSTLTGIADAIREKTGSTAEIAVSGFAEAIGGIETGGEVDNTVLTASQVNSQAAAYLAATSGYTAANRASVSVIGDYEDYTNTAHEDPTGATITLTDTGTLYFLDETDGQNSWSETVSASGAYTCYNLIPNHTYRWWLKNSGGDTVQNGRIRLTGTLRMIYGSNQYLHNMRDNGGWSCDGGTVKYNLLIRGGTLAHQSGTPYVTAKDIMYLHDALGVRLEVDMQYDTTYSASVLGSDVERYVPYSVSVYYADMLKLTGTIYPATAAMLEKIMDFVATGRAAYYHCWSGADRTGTTAVLLLGILGVAETDIDKDYELTCFYGGTDHTDRKRTNAYYNAVFTYLYTFDGDSLRDKVLAWMVQAGVHLDKINRFRAAMSSGTPTALTYTFAVAQNLTGVTSSSSITDITAFEPFTATLTETSGYTLALLTLTMGGKDVKGMYYDKSAKTISIPEVTGDIVLTAVAEAVSISISNTLSGCTTDNSATSTAPGAAYTATISRALGHVLTGATVSITMGGTNITSSAWSATAESGTISIGSVTGDVVISVTAPAGYINRVDEIGWTEDKRLSTSSGGERDATGYSTTGYFDLTSGDINYVCFKGWEAITAQDTMVAIIHYSANGTFVTSDYWHIGSSTINGTFTALPNGVIKWTPRHPDYKVRICGKRNSDSAAIAINEEIT